MNAVVLSVGDEVLIGQVVNTNAAFIAARLASAGAAILEVLTVGDELTEILRGLGEASAIAGREGLVVVTGGLGPTHDDLTKKALSEYFGTPLAGDPLLRERIASLLASRNIPWGPAAEEQSIVPSGAVIFPNRYGTAPGMLLERAGTAVVALPGVPYEMEQIMTDSVLPWVAERIARGGGGVVLHRTLRTTGISESSLSTLIGAPDSIPGGVRLAFLPSLSGVRLRLDATGGTAEAGRRIDAAVEVIRGKAGKYLYAEEDEELEATIGRILSQKRLTLACAESCTGGSIARKITSVPGSSAYFLGGVVAYSDALKESLLGVPSGTIGAHGAVSKETALAMASGVRNVTGADIGVATTGIAGPAGGSPEKPVGLVWIACSDAAGDVAVRQMFGEGRSRVTERATFAALEMVRRRVLGVE